MDRCCVEPMEKFMDKKEKQWDAKDKSPGTVFNSHPPGVGVGSAPKFDMGPTTVSADFFNR